MKLKVAFVGQPNVGKSSLLYQLAGGDVQIGNWAGITVDKYVANLKLENHELELVDLPGIYNLSPYTPEERIARDYLLFEKPDVIVNVVESPLLERNLFLTSQLLELNIPTVLALNMWDEFQQKGFKLDIRKLEEKLGVRAVPVVGKTGWNADRLLDAIIRTFEEKLKPKPFRFSEVIELNLERVKERIKDEPFFGDFPERWLTVKVLENDEYLAEWLKKRYGFDLARCCTKERHYVSEAFNSPPDEAIAEERYRAAAKLVSEVLKKPPSVKRGFSDVLDDLILRPYIGLPLFFLVMFLVFKVSFDVSAPFMEWVDGFVNGFLGKYLLYALQSVGAPDWLLSFVKDGVIGGIGFFATFIPILVFMYLALGFLEHSGYFARAAFTADRFVRPLGLNGKSVVPLILGFGCNVPAVLATRTLENPYLRRLTALLIPFMSCSARLPVYALLALAFFPDRAAVAIFSMYLLGVLVALTVAFIVSRTAYRKNLLELLFIVEIPPYRLPSFKELLRSMWTPVWEFVHRAGTVIFAVNLLVWVFLNIPYGASVRETLLGRFSTTVQPLFEPLGFGKHWENVAVLVPGFLAKELVVTSYGTILGISEGESPKVEKPDLLKDLENQLLGLVKATFKALKALISQFVPTLEVEKPEGELLKRIKGLFTPAAALAFMVFVLLYTPCIATVATLWQEFGFKFALLSVVLNLTVAYALAFAAYRVSLLFLPS